MSEESKPIGETLTKPGYKTTEFWLTVGSSLLSFLYASGIIGEGTQTDKIVGFAVLALSTLGYNISRSIVKK